MASAKRHGSDAVRACLEPEPFRRDFFQAVRRVQAARDDLPRIGHSRHPAEDPLRFCQEPDLAFPTGTIRRTEYRQKIQAQLLYINFMGFIGCNGPMPLCFNEFLLSRVKHHGDRALARFVDMLANRYVAFFFRAWAEARPAVSADRPDDPFGRQIGALCGLGMETLRHRDSIPDSAKRFYAGHLASRSRNAEELGVLLADYFGAPVEVQQFIGHWVDLPKDEQYRLGASTGNDGGGIMLIVGERIWDCSSKFRVRVGPLSLDSYRRLMPGTLGLQRLLDWTLLYAGLEYEWDIQLVLAAKEVPTVRLGESGRMGWDTWVRVGDAERDADDLTLDPRFQACG